MRNFSILLVFLVYIGEVIGGAEHVFHWNSSNVEFRHGRVNAEMDVRIGDTVRFVCPENSEDRHGSRNEYLTVYEVGDLAFGDCQVETVSREVLRCGHETRGERMLRARSNNDGYPVKSSKLSIRDITPVPNGREFVVGQTYYYITTSSGKLEGIDKKWSGLCESANMRLALRILPAIPTTPSPTTTSSTTHPRRRDDKRPSEDEDEDSFDDSSRMQPSVNPKFRRPSEFNLNSAGVHPDQFQKVAQMAKEGKTGSFGNVKIIKAVDDNNDVEIRPWDVDREEPKAVVENLSYQREPDYLIHEENVQSLEYSSSSTTPFIAPIYFYSFLIGLLCMIL